MTKPLENKPPAWWIPERTKRLRELWETTDVSATNIGLELGTTKNAIIGKAHRLGLRLRKMTIKPAPARPRIVIPDKGCRWADRYPGDVDFAFCGEPVRKPGEPWCELHRSKVYTKASQQSEAAE